MYKTRLEIENKNVDIETEIFRNYATGTLPKPLYVFS